MRRIIDARTAVIAALLLSLAGPTATAIALPPTVTNSPGYEARLAESRKARAAQAATAAQPQPQHRKKRRK